MTLHAGQRRLIDVDTFMGSLPFSFGATNEWGIIAEQHLTVYHEMPL